MNDEINWDELWREFVDEEEEYSSFPLDQDDEEEIRNLLMGHRIVKVDSRTLKLDDGTVLTIFPNRGGCSCTSGDYHIADLNDCDNIITNVELEDTVENNEWRENGRVYKIFVYAGHKKINLLSVEGSDGSGYYGTGYKIRVGKP